MTNINNSNFNQWLKIIRDFSFIIENDISDLPDRDVIESTMRYILVESSRNSQAPVEIKNKTTDKSIELIFDFKDSYEIILFCYNDSAVISTISKLSEKGVSLGATWDTEKMEFIINGNSWETPMESCR